MTEHKPCYVIQERGLVHRQPVRAATAEHSLRLQRRHQESDAARRQPLPPRAAQRSHRVRRYSATWCLSILRCRHCRVLVHIFFPNRVVAAEGNVRYVRKYEFYVYGIWKFQKAKKFLEWTACNNMLPLWYAVDVCLWSRWW